MTRLRLVSETRRTQYGFTLVEIMIAMVLAGIVMGAVYQLLIGQSRSYSKQRELMDVHGTLRSAATLLAWEIRQSWAAGGDLYSINANSITLRSVQGAGSVCALHNTLPRTGLGRTWGDFNTTADDSALVYAADTDSWVVGVIDVVWTTPGDAQVPWCDWGDGASIQPDVVLEVTVPSDWNQEDFDAFCNTINQDVARANCLAEPDWPTACAAFGGNDNANCLAALAASGGTGAASGTIEVGAPFRAFRRIEYGLYEEGGRWWLGRKVGAAASYEKLTGPLLAPALGGLVLTYRDAAGNVTADPTQVALIDFVLRAESYRASGHAHEFQQDTLATRVALRG